MNKKLIVISAMWCPSCLLLKKSLKKIKQDFPHLVIQELDYDFDEEVKKYDVGDKLPVIICDNKKLIGEKNYDEIASFLRSNGVI